MAAAKKVSAGMTSGKSPKKSYAKSHQEFIGNPTMQGGKTAKAKAEYEKAKKGGAAKAAKKLTIKTELREKSPGGLYGGGYEKVKVRDTSKEKATAQRIITDKSKTATRAKIVEMNAMKKKAGKK